MSSNNISVLIWLYKAKSNKKGQSPLYLRVSYNGERKNIASGYYLLPERWDAIKCRVRGIQDDAKEINSYIQQTQSRLISLYNEMLREGDVNLNKLIDRLFGRDFTPMTLLELIKHHNNDFQKRIGIDYTFSSFEKYDILRKKIELFIPYKYEKKDLRLQDVSYAFAADFDFYLKHNDKNQHNTVVKYIINLKKILNVAVVNGWISKNPISSFKVTYKEHC